MKTAKAVELIRKARRSGSAEEIDARVELILLDHAKFYSDQQNKELGERADELAIELHETIIKHDELFDEAERLTKEVELLKAGTYKGEVDYLAFVNENQLLRKEVEELKLRLSGKTFFNPFEQENTRLRELLEKCKPILESDKIYNIDSADLIAEIDNALNHKP